ncbi:MAG: rod shape-determining protein RodA [Anaerolineales bacterium]|nr:rod shape-determining protein RodA [Anaerolineales bacterium]
MRNISWRHFDFWLLGAVAFLTIFGVTMIRSAIAGNIELVEANTVIKQIIFAGIGFVILIITAMIDYRYWGALSNILFLVMVGVLAVLFLFGGVLFGSSRWFSVGPILIQPSEFAKIVIILVLANFFSQNIEDIKNPIFVIRSLMVTFFIIVWIILQPDLSTSIVILVLWFAMLWASGLDMKLLLISGGAGILILGIGVPLMLLNYDPENTGGLFKPYQLDRIINFLFPDPNASFGAIYNVQQALISIGEGGWFGQGYGSGSQVQLRFLKVRHSDFIFSALSEEFGFVGAFLVIATLAFIIARCLRAARLSSDTYGALIAYGAATLISFQTVVNIGMNLNLLPVTGLTLPFVSYGGSSLITLFIAIGLVESVILRHKDLEF